MRYAEFRRRGMLVGSGALKSGCRSVIGRRLKPSGLRGTVLGANGILTPGCSIINNRWENIWDPGAAV